MPGVLALVAEVHVGAAEFAAVYAGDESFAGAGDAVGDVGGQAEGDGGESPIFADGFW